MEASYSTYTGKAAVSALLMEVEVIVVMVMVEEELVVVVMMIVPHMDMIRLRSFKGKE